MIDTIKFHIPIETEDLLLKLCGSLSKIKKEKVDTGVVEFEFYSGSVEFGSYNRKVMIRANNKPLGLFVEFSIPKFYKGNNVEMIYAHDLPMIMDKFYKELCAFMKYELPHYSTWSIYRLDICYNWTLESHDQAIIAIDFLKRIDYPRKKKYTYATSVMFKGSTYSPKFYLKGDEFKKHDFDNTNERHVFLLYPSAQKILRFEIAIRKQQLIYLTGTDPVKINNITDDKQILDQLNYYLGTVFKYISKENTDEESVWQLIKRKASSESMAYKLFQFYKSFYYDESSKNKMQQGGINRSTIWRYKTMLSEMGVGLIDESNNDYSFIEKLNIPSDSAIFDLPILEDYS